MKNLFVVAALLSNSEPIRLPVDEALRGPAPYQAHANNLTEADGRADWPFGSGDQDCEERIAELEAELEEA